MPFGTRLGVALATLILAGVPAWARPNFEKLGQECAKGKQSACDQLGQIAQNDANLVQRMWATEQVRDQDLLAKIAATDQELRVRHAAMHRLKYLSNGQSLPGSALDAIGTIALNDTDAEDRLDAVEFLIDQPLLAKIAVDDADSDVRSVAMSGLHDPSLLVKLAISAGTAETRSTALGKISDAPLIAEIALQAADATTRLNAVDRITDQSILASIAIASTDPQVRAAAVWKSGDPSLIDKVAKQDSDAQVRDAARASVWKTVQNEHEIYIWRDPSPDAPAPGTANSRWIISGTVGVAALSEDTSQSNQTDIASVIAASNAPSGSAHLDEKGNLYLPLEPENDDDILHLDSGTLTVNLGTSTKDIPAPFEFQGLRIGRGGVWKITETRAVMYIQPTLLMEANQSLKLGGSYKAASNQSTGQYVGFNIQIGQLDWGPVSITGNLRLPSNEVLPVGTRLEVEGGAIQFDKTGAFLGPGSRYRGVSK